MMLQKRGFGSSLFDEVFNNPFFGGIDSGMMKTDVKEVNGNYVLDMDLPGFNKEDIKMEFEDGYLTITADKSQCTDSDNQNCGYIFQERFIGQCSRSFYIGDSITEKDIRAAYRNGILRVIFPKHDKTTINSNKKYIEIE